MHTILKTVVVSALALAVSATLNTASAVDVALDFEFVRIGQKRTEVIKALGEPTAETKSRTLGIQHRRLVWIADDKKYVIFLLAERVWRLKRCDVRDAVAC